MTTCYDLSRPSISFSRCEYSALALLYTDMTLCMHLPLDVFRWSSNGEHFRDVVQLSMNGTPIHIL